MLQVCPMCISQMILVIFVKGDHSALCARADFTMHYSERKIFEIVSSVFRFKTCRNDPRVFLDGSKS